jgi:hypothetical protein
MSFYHRIESSDPLTLESFISLMRLSDDFTCESIKENNNPIEPVKVAKLDAEGNLIYEPKKDEEGNLVYPIVLDHNNINITLWTGAGQSLASLINEYGDKLVIDSSYSDTEDRVEIIEITIEG